MDLAIVEDEKLETTACSSTNGLKIVQYLFKWKDPDEKEQEGAIKNVKLSVKLHGSYTPGDATSSHLKMRS